MIEIEEDDFLDLIHWARRYCDGRATYASEAFNRVYDKIKLVRPDLLELKDKFDATLKDKGVYFPYAQDGMYNPNTGAYDSRPKHLKNEL